MQLQILKLLEQRQKTKYWLYKQMGMSYQNFNRMVNNETKAIKFDNLEAVCQILECTPNEIFWWEEED